MKCQACKEGQAEWSWQPFGPNEYPDCFSLRGSHYRGFPVIGVCSSCKSAFQTGDFEVHFSYKHHHFIARDHQVKEVHISLWNGGSGSFESARGSATMIMKDTIGETELVAMVADPDLIPVFLAAPSLVEACQEIERLKMHIYRWSESSSVEKADRDAVLVALAKMHVALQVVEEQ